MGQPLVYPYLLTFKSDRQHLFLFRRSAPPPPVEARRVATPLSNSATATATATATTADCCRRSFVLSWLYSHSAGVCRRLRERRAVPSRTFSFSNTLPRPLSVLCKCDRFYLTTRTTRHPLSPRTTTTHLERRLWGGHYWSDVRVLRPQVKFFITIG